jgi:hypothetical protein
MKSRRSSWALLSALFCAVGTRFILTATRSTSDLADAGVLIGATLLGLALFALFMAAQEHSHLKNLEHHMRYPRHPNTANLANRPSSTTASNQPSNRKPDHQRLPVVVLRKENP